MLRLEYPHCQKQEIAAQSIPLFHFCFLEAELTPVIFSLGENGEKIDVRHFLLSSKIFTKLMVEMVVIPPSRIFMDCQREVEKLFPSISSQP
jgi:hypothetical protein